MTRLASLAALLLVLVLVLGLSACGDDEDATTSAATTTGEAGATGASGAAGAPVEIRDVQACLEEDGRDVQRNPGTIGESTGDLVVDSGVTGVLYVFEDAVAAADGEADVREYEEADPYRDREIEVVSNTVIGYETEPAGDLLRLCVSG